MIKQIISKQLIAQYFILNLKDYHLKKGIDEYHPYLLIIFFNFAPLILF